MRTGLRDILLLSSFAMWTVGSMAQDQVFNRDADISISPAVGINTKHLEFAPVYYGNGIVFVQAKERGDLFDKGIGMPYFELLYADLDPNGLPRKPVNFSPNIRTKYHEGPSCFSLNETRVYFTRSNYKDGVNIPGADKRTNLKIYTALKGLEDWEQITELPFCSDDYTVCHPAVSPDDRIIYFASDMPGGYGGMDLYVSERSRNTWTEPVNLGPAVNTKGNEIMPYLHASGILFFSSDGHEGPGNLDLFAIDPGKLPSAPLELLPAPFNSRADDLGIAISADGRQGFFSSNRRKGRGKDDIYHFLSLQELVSPALPEEPRYFQVMASEDKTPIAGAELWIFPMGLTGPLGIDAYFDTEVIPTEKDDGSFLLKVTRNRKGDAGPMMVSDQNGMASSYGQDNGSSFLQVIASGFLPYERVFAQGELAAGDTVAIQLKPIPEQPLEVADNTPAPGDCIEIEGSVARAHDRFAIAFPRISIFNRCDNEELTIQGDGNGRYSACLDPDCAFVLRVSKEGYVDDQRDIRPAEQTEIKHLLQKKELSTTLDEGDLIVLENIYYDFNKSAIQKGAAEELDAVVRIMKDKPAMRIELISHTDSRGTTDYNLELSERRAFSAKDYLVARGIDETRIETTPRGEADIRNKCVDGVECTEAEHQFNRRTEIRILGAVKRPENDAR